ncbi:hypothetical protein MRB53_034599 [Persea americana]|uniref:Uncharacterized protein n=1 Tax=Persea americana TaxID=3435 RepID=A0ACC2K2Q6_PERAE|nr:hypothetical protein MRB53_034599 [Persea americana]
MKTREKNTKKGNERIHSYMRKVAEKESLNEGRRIEGASNRSTSYSLQSLLKDREEWQRAVTAGGIQSKQ